VRTSLRTAALVVLALIATACGRPAGSDPDHPSVVAAFYPLLYVASAVGGAEVSVTSLTPPGAEPHDLELTTDQVRRIADADLVVYLRGFQPQVDETIDQQAVDSAFDTAGVEALRDGEDDHGDGDAGGKDLHVWLDPIRLATIADRLADRLAKVDPDGAAGYRTRAADLRTGLEGLDREYADALGRCDRREIVTSHAAFGYLAERYDLRQIAISGLSPEAEPSPQRLADVARQAREHHVRTIFFETLVSPKVAETLAREVGARAEVLDPIEGLAPGATGDYVTVMRDNLARLRTALGCT
jgi:zinc transport system substrate-binding protein